MAAVTIAMPFASWLALYIIGSCFLVLARPRMIWQEKSQKYRLMLLVLTFPLLMTLNLASFAWMFATSMSKMCKAIYEGEGI